MGSKPDVYGNLIRSSANQALREEAASVAQEHLSDIIDLPDPIAGTGLSALAKGKITPQDLGKQAAQYGLNYIGFPIPVFTAIAMVMAFADALSKSQRASVYGSFDKNNNMSVAETANVFALIENDITMTEFITWAQGLLVDFAKDAELRKVEYDKLKARARSIRPPYGKYMVDMIKNPGALKDMQINPRFDVCKDGATSDTIVSTSGDYYLPVQQRNTNV